MSSQTRGADEPPSAREMEAARHAAEQTLIRLQPVFEWARQYAPDLLDFLYAVNARATAVKDDPRSGYQLPAAREAIALPPARPPEEIPGVFGDSAEEIVRRCLQRLLATLDGLVEKQIEMQTREGAFPVLRLTLSEEGVGMFVEAMGLGFSVEEIGESVHYDGMVKVGLRYFEAPDGDSRQVLRHMAMQCALDLRPHRALGPVRLGRKIPLSVTANVQDELAITIGLDVEGTERLADQRRS